MFCFSVGLTASMGNVPDVSDHLKWLGLFESLPWLLYNTLLMTGATAMVIGLVQQIVFLAQTELKTATNRSALNLAVAWRIAVVILLTTSVIVKTGLHLQLIHFPEKEGVTFFFYNRVFPDYILYGCMIVVLFDILGQRHSFNTRRETRVLICAVASVVALVVLADAMQVMYLVYKAFAGIEMAQPTKFRRPGAYPDFEAEGYWLFWLASGATTVALLGSCILLSVVRQWERSQVRRILSAGIGVTLLGVSSAFGYWFLFVGLPKMSPDYAEGGYASTWWEWFEAASVLVIAIPAFAYRLIVGPSRSLEVGKHIQPMLALHQSLIVSIVLALSAVFQIVSLVQVYEIFGSTMMPNTNVWQRLLWMIIDINFFVPIAVSLLSLQLLWKQWKTPTAAHIIRITSIAPWRFLLACAALILILVLSIPTVYAFCFAYWVAPWS